MLNDSHDPAGNAPSAPRSRARDAHKSRRSKAATPQGEATCGSEADILAALATAVLCPDRAEGERQLRAVLDSGIDRSALIDRYIPAAARRFGEAWADSGHSFAEVTIAVARLQGWLRDLDDGGRDDAFRFDAPEVLLVVAEGSQHTLGAMVAMSCFRRCGALVRLSLGQDARTIGQIVRSHHFDLVAISAAGNEDLDFLAGVINSIRSGVGPAPRVVLGGEMLNQLPEAAALVGADHGTSDPEEALSLCGLTISANVGSPAGSPVQKARGRPERVPTGA
jgi:methanogenic corrinoid protein MtbC1